MTYVEYWAQQYERAHGKPAPKVTIKRGWARIEGLGAKFRERDLGALGRELERMANEREAAERTP
jgi:hypothetical protein